MVGRYLAFEKAEFLGDICYAAWPHKISPRRSCRVLKQMLHLDERNLALCQFQLNNVLLLVCSIWSLKSISASIKVHNPSSHALPATNYVEACETLAQFIKRLFFGSGSKRRIRSF